MNVLIFSRNGGEESAGAARAVLRCSGFCAGPPGFAAIVMSVSSPNVGTIGTGYKTPPSTRSVYAKGRSSINCSPTDVVIGLRHYGPHLERRHSQEAEIQCSFSFFPYSQQMAFFTREQADEVLTMFPC